MSISIYIHIYRSRVNPTQADLPGWRAALTCVPAAASLCAAGRREGARPAAGAPARVSHSFLVIWTHNLGETGKVPRYKSFFYKMADQGGE